MIPRRTALRLWLPLGCLLALSGCGIHGLHVPQSPLLRMFVGSSGHIAYVGADGNLYVAMQSGAATRITKGSQSVSGKHVTYVSPTWGPAGRRLAYARYLVDPTNGSSTVQFHVFDWKTKQDVVAFSSNTLKPFYFDWAPDGKSIAVLSDVNGALQFGAVEANRADSYHKLDAGSPYYWAWEPNGRALIAHTDFSAHGGGRLSVVSPEGPLEAVDLSEHLGLFQAPAVLPDGRIVAVFSSDGSSRLAVVNPATGTTDPFGPKSAVGFLFSLAPNGKLLAFLQPQARQGKAIGVLHVINLASGKEIFSLETRSTVGYFWSPGSDRIAFYTPAQPQKLDSAFAQVKSLPLLTLEVANIRTGKSWKVATFPPTQALLSTLPFTDQYQHSETIWSPNGRSLLFTAYTSKGIPGVFVADASGNIQPRKIADGDSAVWSWR